MVPISQKCYLRPTDWGESRLITNLRWVMGAKHRTIALPGIDLLDGSLIAGFSRLVDLIRYERRYAYR